MIHKVQGTAGPKKNDYFTLEKISFGFYIGTFSPSHDLSKGLIFQIPPLEAPWLM